MVTQVFRLVDIHQLRIMADWPAYNTIKNCTSHNNADAGYEDADGLQLSYNQGNGKCIRWLYCTS